MEVLTTGQLAGAALDVFESKPQALKEFFNMENMIVTPHIGAYTNETLRRMDEACISALSSALQNNKKEEPTH
jgi:phosphoglycerate dehydrogenase-like enzyme